MGHTYEPNHWVIPSYNSPHGSAQRDILRIFEGHLRFYLSRVKYSIIALGNKDCLIQGNSVFIHCLLVYFLSLFLLWRATFLYPCVVGSHSYFFMSNCDYYCIRI